MLFIAILIQIRSHAKGGHSNEQMDCIPLSDCNDLAGRWMLALPKHHHHQN